MGRTDTYFSLKSLTYEQAVDLLEERAKVNEELITLNRKTVGDVFVGIFDNREIHLTEESFEAFADIIGARVYSNDDEMNFYVELCEKEYKVFCLKD